MFNRIRKSMEDRDGGFTLIELLVVVIIIGILAAIAIPVFLNQRRGAVQSTVDSDLRNNAIAIEQFYTSSGSYPTSAAQAGQVVTYAPANASVAPSKISDVDSAFTYVAPTNAGLDNWCIQIINPNSTNGATATSVSSTNSTPTAAACP